MGQGKQEQRLFDSPVGEDLDGKRQVALLGGFELRHFALTGDRIQLLAR